MDSILTSIKKAVGIEEADEHFDADIIMHINSVFMILNDLGVGPDEGFSINDATTTWVNYLGEVKLLEGVKSYMILKVRLLFDPPSSSFVIQSMEKQISELEWRIMVKANPPVVEPAIVVEEEIV